MKTSLNQVVKTEPAAGRKITRHSSFNLTEVEMLQAMAAWVLKTRGDLSSDEICALKVFAGAADGGTPIPSIEESSLYPMPEVGGRSIFSSETLGVSLIGHENVASLTGQDYCLSLTVWETVGAGATQSPFGPLFDNGGKLVASPEKKRKLFKRKS